MAYNCAQCGEPIKEGNVLVTHIGGKPAYLHMQFDDMNPQIRPGQSMRDCPNDYMMQKGQVLMGQRISFSEFERMVTKAAAEAQNR